MILVASSWLIPSTHNATLLFERGYNSRLCSHSLKSYQFVMIYEQLTSLYILNSSIKHSSKYPHKALGSWVDAVLNWFPNSRVGRWEWSFITQLCFLIYICVHGSCKTHHLLTSAFLYLSHFLKKRGGSPFWFFNSVKEKNNKVYFICDPWAGHHDHVLFQEG